MNRLKDRGERDDANAPRRRGQAFFEQARHLDCFARRATTAHAGDIHPGKLLKPGH